MMTRREAIIYLMDNPKNKVKMIKNADGMFVDNYIVFINEDGELFANGFNFSVYFEGDRSQFVIAGELKQMSFSDAIEEILHTDLYMTSEVTDNIYNQHMTINDLMENEIKGLWTVEGIYE